MNDISDYIEVPLKCTLTRDNETKSKYNIHIQKYGARFNGLTINLTEDQINQIKFWR